jgi:hypothetical protein
MPIRLRCQRVIRSVTYGLSTNMTQICDSLSEAEKGAFSLLFGHPVWSVKPVRTSILCSSLEQETTEDFCNSSRCKGYGSRWTHWGSDRMLIAFQIAAVHEGKYSRFEWTQREMFGFQAWGSDRMLTSFRNTSEVYELGYLNLLQSGWPVSGNRSDVGLESRRKAVSDAFSLTVRSEKVDCESIQSCLSQPFEPMMNRGHQIDGFGPIFRIEMDFHWKEQILTLKRGSIDSRIRWWTLRFSIHDEGFVIMSKNGNKSRRRAR